MGCHNHGPAYGLTVSRLSNRHNPMQFDTVDSTVDVDHFEAEKTTKTNPNGYDPLDSIRNRLSMRQSKGPFKNLEYFVTVNYKSV